MKTVAVQRSFNYYTNLNIRYHEIIRLSNAGLLGQVEHHANSKHRDFNASNSNRAFIILFAQFCLGNEWSNDAWKTFFDSKDESLINELVRQAEKIESKGIPKFKELLMEMSNGR